MSDLNNLTAIFDDARKRGADPLRAVYMAGWNKGALEVNEARGWEYGIEYSPNNEHFDGSPRDEIEGRIAYIRSHDGGYARTMHLIRRHPAGPSERVPDGE